MSALDFKREYEAIVDELWGRAKTNALAFLRNNLPTSSGTLGNSAQFPDHTSLAGKNLYATGSLRDSYREINLGGAAGTGNYRTTALVSVSPYAYYYANGRRNSATYHGFDFIGQTKRDLEEMLDRIIVTGFGTGDHIF